MNNKTSKITYVSDSMYTRNVTDEAFGPAWSCVCFELNKVDLPCSSPGFYQGFAKVEDDNGNAGFFILVKANPDSKIVAGMMPQEIWLSPVDDSRLCLEFKKVEYSKFSKPETGHKITFHSISGPNPEKRNSITPPGFSAGCVSSTLLNEAYRV